MPLFQNKSFYKPFHNYENEFDLLEIETEGRTHCPLNGFELRQTEAKMYLGYDLFIWTLRTF